MEPNRKGALIGSNMVDFPEDYKSAYCHPLA